MTKQDRVWLILLTLVAGTLRLVRLDAQSLWIDEFLMILRASLGEPFRWSDWFVNPQGPLPALLLRWSVALFGSSEWALRLPSALLGTATVPVVFLLARRLHSSSAWPTAILVTISPFLVWYSQETRHYALAILAAAWSGIAFIRLMDDKPDRGAAWQYSLSLLVGLMSHLMMGFVALAHGLTLLIWRRHRLPAWLGAVVPAFVLFSPWLWVAVTQNLNLAHVAGAGPIPADELLRGESTFSWLGLPYTFFVFLAGYTLGPTLVELHDAPRWVTVLPHLGTLVPLALGAIVLAIAGLSAMRREPALRGLILLSIAVPLLGVTLLSLRNAKVFHPRYVALALPFLLTLLGAGFAHLRATRRSLGYAAAFLVMAPSLVSLGNYYGNGRYAREDSRGAARILLAMATDSDIVLGQGAPQLLEWYEHGPAPVVVVYEPWLRDPKALDARIEGWAAGRRHVWLMCVRPWLQDPKRTLKAELDHRFGPGETYPLNGVTLIRYSTGR